MGVSFPVRRFMPALLALVAALLAACGGPDIPITGTVTDAYTGKPVSDATIELGRNQLTTDASGAFQIANWSAKDTIEITANGYEPLQLPLEAQQQLQQPTPPAVSLDEIKIRPNTLSGVITDIYSGQPLAGVEVRAGDTISATTDAGGHYTLTNVPESFTVAISAADYDQLVQNVSRTTSFDTALRPNVVTGQLRDQFTDEPLAGATIKVGEQTTTTDADGNYRLTNVPPNGTLQISADGYAELTQTLDKTTTVDAALRPDVLKGTLVDATTKQPIADATIIATTALNNSDVAYMRIDNSTDGSFTLEGIPEQGYLQVLSPGYRKAVVELKQGVIPTTIEMEPFTVKSIYVTAAVAANSELLNEYFDLIDRTELNAIVIDLKSDLRDDLGLVYYDSQVPLVKELGTSQPYMDLEAILAEAKRRNIYTIARVHIFSHDNVLADAKPEWAAKDRVTGEVFADYPTPTIRYAWLDPWNRNVWDYNIQLAVEAAHLGFDEINYDYIRFPSLEFDPEDKNRLLLSKETSTAEERFNNIATMLEQSQRAINGAGAFLSVDVFGYAAWNPFELIGQDIGLMSEHTDYIYPMVYPSHFVPGELGFDNPGAHPYEIILESLKRGQKQIEGKRALLRPWLQDFTLVWVPKDMIVEYGPKEVRAQIQATEDFGQAAGWILYDSANIYTEEALKPEQ